MNPPQNERRSRKRVAARVAVTIEPAEGGAGATGYTRDISSNGIFLYSDSRLEQGSELEMVLMLPAELAGGERQWVCCQATVVRVEKEAGRGGVGVAASITNMQVMPEAAG